MLFYTPPLGFPFLYFHLYSSRKNYNWLSVPEKNINKISESQEISNESLEGQNEALAQIDSSDKVEGLLEGMEGSISESVKDKKEGDSGGSVTKKGGTKKQEDKKKTPPKPVYRPLPSTGVMRRQVLKSMKQEEKGLVREAAKLEKKPYEYAEKIKEIRSLRQKISDFLSLALDAIKDTYLKLFGKKHGIETEDDK